MLKPRLGAGIGKAYFQYKGTVGLTIDAGDWCPVTGDIRLRLGLKAEIYGRSCIVGDMKRAFVRHGTRIPG